MRRVGGALVIRHQVALALTAGCRRVICFAHGFSPGFAELQRDAEQAGATFHLVSGPAGLSGLVTAADELLVIAEGLLPTPGDTLPLVAGGPAVFVLPADEGIAAGFERIDLNHAWGGLMLAPGRLVDRLMDLAADVDAVSALLRLSLQAGVPLRNVPAPARAAGHWLLIRTEADAHLAEDQWIQRHTLDGARTPGPWLARSVIRRFGGAMLHEHSSSAIGLGTAALLAVLGLAAGWFGQVVPALMLTGLAGVSHGIGLLLLRLRQAASGQHSAMQRVGVVSGAMLDLLLVAILALAAAPLPGQGWALRAFPPLILLGLLRLVARVLGPPVGAWLQDRLVLAAVLSVLSLGRVLEPSVPLLSVILLMAGLVLPARPATTNPAGIPRA